MVETRAMLVCPQCLIDWPVGGAPACEDPCHQGGHRRYDLHWHRSRIVLPDGTPVVPASFYAGDPYGRDERPDYGLYLDPRWQPPWPHRHLDWPDFGVPDDRTELVAVLGSVLGRARAGQRVEMGCWGGHGRTGTAMAALAVMAGYPAGEAVGWVKANYCERAVETADQEALILSLEEP